MSMRVCGSRKEANLAGTAEVTEVRCKTSRVRGVTIQREKRTRQDEMALTKAKGDVGKRENVGRGAWTRVSIHGSLEELALM